MPDQSHDVTLGEVYRGQREGFERIDKRLDTITRDMIGRAEYESDQEGVERRFAASDVVHANLQAEIKAVLDRIERAETEQRQAKSRWQQSLALACLAAVLAVIVPLMLGGLLG